LVPRPETETLIEAALAAVDREQRRTRALRLADLGTGSGALLIALLSELPAAHGVGTDINLAALACARDNARALGYAGRASFVACDYGAALAGPFDLLLCNPPYVAHGEIAGLAPDVRLYDPLRALDGGLDGLDGYRALVAMPGGCWRHMAALLSSLASPRSTLLVRCSLRPGFVPPNRLGTISPV